MQVGGERFGHIRVSRSILIPELRHCSPLIDRGHPLAVLSTHMPWQEIEASLAGVIARKVKAGKKVEDIDLFGPVVKVSGGWVSNAGRHRLPMRLMVSLLYLKHTYF